MVFSFINQIKNPVHPTRPACRSETDLSADLCGRDLSASGGSRHRGTPESLPAVRVAGLPAVCVVGLNPYDLIHPAYPAFNKCHTN